MAGLARPVRTVLKLRLVASTDFSIFSICSSTSAAGLVWSEQRGNAGYAGRAVAWAAVVWSGLASGMQIAFRDVHRGQVKVERTASSSTVISTSADACAASAARRAASLREREGAFSLQMRHICY